jgi:excisionase family DNA binding protein
MTSSVHDARTTLLSELQSLTESSARLLSTTQVALLFGVCDRTIRVWAKKKRIPAIRIPSGHWKFSAIDVLHSYKAGVQEVQLPPE